MSESTMSSKRESSLRKLAGMMNTRHRLPFPISKQLLDCFDVALTSEEIDFCLRMGKEPFACEEIPARSGLPESVAQPLFDSLMRKGLFWPQPATGPKEIYALSGIMLGWFEIYLSDGAETPEKREFARRLDIWFKSWGKMNYFPLRNFINNRMKRIQPGQAIVAITGAERPSGRTIAVNRTVDAPPMKIYPPNTVLELIEKHGETDNIAVIHCFCRQYHKMVGEPCRFQMPPESCIAIGRLSHHAVSTGAGRHISKEEAIALIQELESRGAVHQVFHEGEDLAKPEVGICNCCWDCCGVFGSYNRAYFPIVFKSFFEAHLKDASECNGCETCVEHCPVQAIALVDSRARINGSKCIGCGQCELQCPEEAIHLIPNERNVLLPMGKRSEARIAG